MSDGEKGNDDSLEWLKLKTEKGQIPNYMNKKQTESNTSKFFRKFSENPFVPIGKYF